MSLVPLVPVRAVSSFAYLDRGKNEYFTQRWHPQIWFKCPIRIEVSQAVWLTTLVLIECELDLFEAVEHLGWVDLLADSLDVAELLLGDRDSDPHTHTQENTELPVVTVFLEKVKKPVEIAIIEVGSSVFQAHD